MGKDTNKIIYLVTAGSYSDYRVMGAYSTPEKAQAYIDYRELDEDDDADIEEYELDPVDTAKKYINVHMDINGNVGEHNYFNIIFKEPGEVTETINVLENASGYNVYRQKYCFDTWVQTDDKTRAVKVASERLMRYKAENNL